MPSVQGAINKIMQDMSVTHLSQLSPEGLMFEIQILLTKEFNEQMSDLARKLKFLNDIKESYRKNLNGIQQFMAQNPNMSRKDGKAYYEVGFAEVAGLAENLVHYDYRLEDQAVTEVFLNVNDDGGKHQLDEEGLVTVKNGASSIKDWAEFFKTGAQIKDAGEAQEFADKMGDDDGELFFYYGHTNNTDENGFPKFAVFADALDRMMEQVKNSLTDVEEKTEELSVSLNQLAQQRRSALENASLLLKKFSDIHLNTVSKI